MYRLISPLRISKLFTLLVITAGCLVLFSASAFAQADPQSEATETVTEPGVLIVAVSPESAAAAAGLVRGDIVLRVDNTEVNDATALRTAIAALAPEDTVTLTVLHGDDERELEVTLGKLDGNAFLGVTPYVDRATMQDFTIARPAVPGQRAERFVRPFLRPAEPLREMMGPMTVTLTIADVIIDSPAAAAGLQVSDTIVAINGETPMNPHALVSAVNKLAPGDTLTLTVQMADGEEEMVAIELGAHPDDGERAYLGIRFTVAVQIDQQMNRPQGQGGSNYKFKIEKREEDAQVRVE